ncbi:prolyl aminopeptidase (secreted protein), partial [Metarhizium majus ARSEF 297]
MRICNWVLHAAIIGQATCLQGSNFNITPEFAVQNGCDEKCQATLAKVNAIDLGIFGQNFDFDWFATANNFSGSKPGDVLKMQAMDPKMLGEQVKQGTTVYRIQYASVDLDNSTVPATGFIALPFAPPSLKSKASNSCSSHQFPLVAYAHGTSGVYRGWQLLLQRGYAGLGSNQTEHKYCSFPVQVNDIVYSVVAARKAMGNIFTQEWMAVGHSEGGGAVWKLAESRFVKDVSKYLGTVSLAPALKIADMLRNHTDFILKSGYLTLVAKALQRFSPSYNFTMLGQVQRQRMAIADTSQPCLIAQGAISVGLTREQVLDEKGFETDLQLLQSWQDKMAPASGGRTSAPLLLVQGLNDTAVVAQVAHESWQKACQDQSEAHLREYTELDHSGVIVAAASEWLAWVDARFNGEATSGNCTGLQRVPFDAAHVIAPPEKPEDADA